MSKKNVIKASIVFLFLFAALISPGQDLGYLDLSPAEFKSKIDSLSDEVVLDLRTSDELKKGMIENANQIDYFKLDFENQISKLDKNKTYFLYCASGGRSTETAELMNKLGFKRIYNLKDGFNSWKKMKMPVIPAKK
jgi:rhodanese-related sulfurtransferase